MEDLWIRRMERSDMASLMRLKGAAGWNQVDRDWETLLEISPTGCFVAERNKQVVASATAVPYGNRFGWIGMVIVDPDHRRKGIASEMMGRAIEYLEEFPCVCSKLDATDEGAEVYRRMGFREEYRVERWRREPAHLASTNRSTSGVKIVQLQGLPSLGLDFSAFGANRKALLRRLERGCPQVSHAAFFCDQLLGFTLGREGSGSFQLGPLVAEEPEIAEALLLAGLKGVEDHSVIADIHRKTAAPAELLRSCGFRRTRVLNRMYRGENRFPGQPAKVFLLAGFEFG